MTIVDFSFSPGTITVNVGDTVTWVNDGPTPHSATSSNGAFDTGIFPAGQSRSHTFNEAGTFSYICTPHPNMRGTVVVQGAQTGGGDSRGPTRARGAGWHRQPPARPPSRTGRRCPNSGADSGALILGGLLLMLGWRSPALGPSSGAPRLRRRDGADALDVRAGARRVTSPPCRAGRSASSWPSPAWTATTAAPRSSPARFATPAWRSSTPAFTRPRSRSSRRCSRRTPTRWGSRSSRART